MGALTFENLPEDFSREEKQMLIQYVDNGVPGMGKVTESDIFQWFTMYMAGKTFTEISVAFKVNKEKILFIAHKSNWLSKRIDHFTDITSQLQNKVSAAQIESANTLATIVSSFNKYYNEEFTKFLKTNDKAIIESLDTKLLSQYQKAVESFAKIVGNSTQSPDENGKRNPSVIVNMAGGNLKENTDGSISITENPPDAATLGELLKFMAAAKKANSEEKGE